MQPPEGISEYRNVVKKERSKTDPGPLKPSGGISGFLATVGGQGQILQELPWIVKPELCNLRPCQDNVPTTTLILYTDSGG